jgi:hypothetical protein
MANPILFILAQNMFVLLSIECEGNLPAGSGRFPAPD